MGIFRCGLGCLSQLQTGAGNVSFALDLHRTRQYSWIIVCQRFLVTMLPLRPAFEPLGLAGGGEVSKNSVLVFHHVKPTVLDP